MVDLGSEPGSLDRVDRVGSPGIIAEQDCRWSLRRIRYFWG